MQVIGGCQGRLVELGVPLELGVLPGGRPVLKHGPTGRSPVNGAAMPPAPFTGLWPVAPPFTAGRIGGRRLIREAHPARGGVPLELGVLPGGRPEARAYRPKPRERGCHASSPVHGALACSPAVHGGADRGTAPNSRGTPSEIRMRRTASHSGVGQNRDHARGDRTPRGRCDRSPACVIAQGGCGLLAWASSAQMERIASSSPSPSGTDSPGVLA